MRRAVIVLGTSLLLAACLSSGDRPAQWLAGVDPIYPAQAKVSGVQGYVVLEYRVNEFGEVLDPVVVESEPPGVFDASALAAVRSWRYRPAVRDGEDVVVPAMSSRLDFKLDDGAYKGY
ncbi:MAG: energy transducer TonB [Pseudomonadales bacterium]